MIKFFRKIRQQLAYDNKPDKYLRYAFGEILLVVIGILIAIQINNWNENRKNQKLASVYKLALINDLLLDISHFDYHSALAIQENKGIDSIRTILNKPNSNVDSLNKIIKNGLLFIRKEAYIMLATSEFPSLNDNTFLSLQNSGEIAILDNRLQEKLVIFYGYSTKYSFMIKEIIASKNEMYFDYINTVPYKQSKLNVVNAQLYEQLWNNVDFEKVQIKFITLLNAYYELNLKDEFFNSIRKAKTNIMIDLLKADINK